MGHNFVFVSDRYEIVKSLKKAGSDLNAMDCHGFTPLHTAVYLERMKIVHEMLKWKVKVNQKNSDGCSPLHSAAMRGQSI